MSRQLKLLVALFSFGTATMVLTPLHSPSHAQTADSFTSLGIADSIEVVGENIEGGEVVTHTGGQYRLSSEEYDPHTYGVTIAAPAVEFTYTDETLLENTIPVMTKGTIPIKVTAQNGAIAVGDRVATSEMEGVAMLAKKTAFPWALLKNLLIQQIQTRSVKS